MYFVIPFILFESSESAELFREYMFSKHHNLNFTVEQKNVGSLLFLDVKICRKNRKFVTSVYRKPTSSGAFTNYESFIPTYQKRGLLHTLLHRSFSICCDFKTFHFEIDHLKLIILKLIILKLIIKKLLPLEFHRFIKSCILNVLNHFLINYIHLKLWFRMCLK